MVISSNSPLKAVSVLMRLASLGLGEMDLENFQGRL